MFNRKPKVNLRWPATLSFVTESNNENERFSRGKLKVFFKGETPDHRFFSDEFSEELIKSLPYTPIVSYYDEKKDDFVGHATEQSIYGIVDPCTDVVFEENNGETWAICDTIYYTERPDKVGEIAKKIEGHSQSLELDPSTVKYTVNYDERKHFKNIEFTAGHFIGVSVLGNDQEPAFTGSAFFASDEQFQQKMEILKNYCEGKTDHLGETKNMDVTEFLKLSWGDICAKVSDAVNQEYGNEYYTYAVDFYDDCGIYRFYSYIDGSVKLMKLFYTLNDDGEVTLGKIVETHVVYEDLEDTAQTGTDFTSSNEFTDSGDGDFTVETTTTTTEETTPVVPTETDQTPVEFTNGSTEPTPVVTNPSAEAAVNDTEVSAASEEQNQQENTSPASFTDSERAELEALKREKKVTLINSYELTDEVREDLMNQLDTLTYEELEFKLLKIYKENAEADNFSTAPVPFAVPEPQTKRTAEDNLNAYIRRKLGR